MSSDKEDHYTERSPNTNAFHLASLSTISLIHLARDEGLALSILFVEALILVGLAYLRQKVRRGTPREGAAAVGER